MIKLELVSPDGVVKKYKGTEFHDAFLKFCEDLKQAKAKSILRVYLKDERTKDIILYPVIIRRLLINDLARVLLEKRLRMLMGI